jgi:hypothetical protein
MAVGTTEAHGLALILGVLLWRAAPLRSWHLTALAIHVLLGTSNLVFWQVFVAADFLAAGYITTSLHELFVVLQLFAPTTAPGVNTSNENRPPESRWIHASNYHS